MQICFAGRYLVHALKPLGIAIQVHAAGRSQAVSATDRDFAGGTGVERVSESGV